MPPARRAAARPDATPPTGAAAARACRVLVLSIGLAAVLGPGTAAAASAGIDVERIPTRTVVDERGEERRVSPANLLCGRIGGGAPDRPAAATANAGGSDEATGAAGAGAGADGGRRIGIAGGDRRLDLFSPEALGDGAGTGGGAAREPALLTGIYRTVVTVYNPNGLAAYPVIRAVPTTPALAKGRADQIPPLAERLAPRRSIEIDCADVVGLLGEAFRLDADFLNTHFAGGLLTVETAGRDLDVTAVYTFRPIE